MLQCSLCLTWAVLCIGGAGHLYKPVAATDALMRNFSVLRAIVPQLFKAHGCANSMSCYLIRVSVTWISDHSNDLSTA